MLKSLIFIIPHNRRAIGKLSEVKLVTSLLVSLRNAGALKLFWFQVPSELQRKTTQNPKIVLSSLPRTQNVKENGLYKRS